MQLLRICGKSNYATNPRRDYLLIICVTRTVRARFAAFLLITAHATALWLAVPVTVDAIIQDQTWTNTGPFGGKITALATHPADTNIVFAGTYGGGLFKSVDRGESWIPVNDGLPIWEDISIGSPTTSSWWFGDYYPIALIRFNPQNPNHLYVGTSGGGVAQSSDGGTSWTQTNLGLPDLVIVRDLWIHPLSPSILYCGAGYPNGGLYRSTDGGQNWSLVAGLPSGASYRVTTIQHAPNTPDTLYVGIDSAGEPEFPWGLLRSTDGGQNWDTLSQTYTFYDLQIDPDNPQRLWSVVYTGYLQYFLGSSNDGGYSWQFYPNMNDPWEPVVDLYVDPAWNLYAVHINGNHIKKSTDHGATWQTTAEAMPFYPISNVFPAAGPNIAANALNPNTIYFGSEVGVYYSDDGGQSVRLGENGMVNTYINDVEVNPQNPFIVYAGGEQGLWKSADGGQTWLRLNTTRVNAISIDPTNPDTVYWGGFDGLFRSYDGGITEAKIKDGIITALEIHPESSGTIFAGVYSSTLYKSTDQGDSWTLSYSIPSSSWRIKDIAISSANPNVMYLGSSWSGGLYRSEDSGSTWEKMSYPGSAASIALHPTDANILYITTGLSDQKSTVYVSEDGGEIFQEIQTGITAIRMSKIALDPSNQSHLLLGTRDQGIFTSTDAGGTWSPLTGPYDPRITDFHYLPEQKRFYIGTHGSGIWLNDDFTLGIKESETSPPVPYRVYLYPAFPNPFNPIVTIPFYLAENASVEAAIYTITGALIKTFPQKFYSSGLNRLIWDSGRDTNIPLPSGVYVIRLRSGSSTMTRKITLLK